MKVTLMFVTLLIVYAAYGYGGASASSEHVTIATQLVSLYVVALIHLLFLCAIAIQVDLWREIGQSRVWRLFLEKVVFIYGLLLWNDVYIPNKLVQDHVLLVLAVITAGLWFWRSEAVAAGVVALIRKSTPRAPIHLVPGSSHSERQFNCAVGLIFIAVLPFFFSHAESIFGPR